MPEQNDRIERCWKLYQEETAGYKHAATSYDQLPEMIKDYLFQLLDNPTLVLANKHKKP